MKKVDYYIPSESQVVLDPGKKSSVLNQVCEFFIGEDDGKLYLVSGISSHQYIREIPDEVCRNILKLRDEGKLTNASVNQELRPLKQACILYLMQHLEQNQVNLSWLFQNACGYAAKMEQPVLLFKKGALHLDTFNDIFSLSFSVPLDDPDRALVLTSEEHILRESEQINFIMLVDDKIYFASGFAQNGTFHLQSLLDCDTMLHRDLFEKEAPLPEIYQRFTTRKNRFIALRHT